MYLFGIILRAIKNNIQYLFFIPSALTHFVKWMLFGCYLYPVLCVETQMCVSVSITIIRTQKIIIVTEKKRDIGVDWEMKATWFTRGVTSVNLLLCVHIFGSPKVTFFNYYFYFIFTRARDDVHLTLPQKYNKKKLFQMR